MSTHARGPRRAAVVGRRLLSDRVSTQSASSRPILVRAINTVAPTTELLNKYSPTYTCLFLGAQWFLENGGRDALGGNGKSVIMDAALLMGDDPYRYPDNLPRVNATGGPGGKPSCGSLPDISKNYPGEVPRHRHGVRHGPRCAAEPRHRVPGLRELLPCHQGRCRSRRRSAIRADRRRVRCRPIPERLRTAPRCTRPTEPCYIRAWYLRHPRRRGSHETSNAQSGPRGWCCSPRCAWSSCSRS